MTNRKLILSNNMILSVLLILFSNCAAYGQTGLITCQKATGRVPDRIISIYFDLGKVYPICVRPGQETYLHFSTAIDDAKTASTEDLFREVWPGDARRLTIRLARGHALPTDLHVFSGKKVFVFDIIPTTDSNQEVINIAGVYGAASFVGETSRKLIGSSDTGSVSRVIFAGEKTLVAESDRPIPVVAKAANLSGVKKTASKTKGDTYDAIVPTKGDGK